MTRLMQIKKGSARRVGLIKAHERLPDGNSSIYGLAQIAIDTQEKLSTVTRQRRQSDILDYELIYTGRSEWRVLPAIDHPQVSGTGLTHIGSARGRQSRHATATEDLKDRMNMFRWGVEGRRPLTNPVRVEKSQPGIVKVVPLG